MIWATISRQVCHYDVVSADRVTQMLGMSEVCEESPSIRWRRFFKNTPSSSHNSNTYNTPHSGSRYDRTHHRTARLPEVVIAADRAHPRDGTLLPDRVHSRGHCHSSWSVRSPPSPRLRRAEALDCGRGCGLISAPLVILLRGFPPSPRLRRTGLLRTKLWRLPRWVLR